MRREQTKQGRGFVRRQCIYRQRGEEGDAEVRDEGQGDQAEHQRQEDQQMAGDHQQEELEAANQKTDRTKRILCKFAASYFQILFNGPRMVWRCGAKMVKIEVPYMLLLFVGVRFGLLQVCLHLE